nr:MAG TPA: hypothetical protein [Caudoviricetes sp.]
MNIGYPGAGSLFYGKNPAPIYFKAKRLWKF